MPDIEPINDTLLLFVDFLYALVFWAIAEETYAEIIKQEYVDLITLIRKIVDIITIVSLFYFLAWDWINARLLTLRNPYKGYSRFFIEIAIAMCEYIAVMEAIKKNITVLWYVALIFILGCFWAWRTLRDHPESKDRKELKTIIITHLHAAIVAITLYAFMRRYCDKPLKLSIIIPVILLEWAFLLYYNFIMLWRCGKMAHGPGVPFLSTRDVKYLKACCSRLIYNWGKKGKSQ